MRFWNNNSKLFSFYKRFNKSW